MIQCCNLRSCGGGGAISIYTNNCAIQLLTYFLFHDLSDAMLACVFIIEFWQIIMA